MSQLEQKSQLYVAIAEDNDEFRLTLRDIISYEPGMVVPALWRNGREVIDNIAKVNPDILLLDINMPVMDGVETVRALRERQCDIKIIMLTMYDDEKSVLQCLRYGASAYLVKDGSVDEILHAVREVAAGRGVVHPQVTPILLNAVAQSARLNETWKDVLTAREYEVLRELATGKSNEQISETLHISVKTAKNHVSHILAKLGVADRAQAVLYALRKRWVEL
ncbi:response regulator transcription factor [Alicyclobacillus fastidiosus]|uniref:Response regulator transcription factor n=1 Tax=Alicyclobacillus fastidiosus TaxID=392011 RepID=A0ABY6ZJ66_9BACL|nr:response regulator transcription factor [Alicyclobacillus fastidiosus]WAH42633.1 response regulator transcription factor [Alicyclobacillus fastidiosus]GMA64505.1 DNA-binding response regulator [Alicyclobacillus fastidiosus]